MREDFILERVATIPESGCWIWLGATNTQGYGHLRLNQKCIKAHRLAYTIRFGEIPAGMFVLHKCDVRPCVNPVHLYLGDQTDNMRDMMVRGRCGAHKNSVVTDEMRARIFHYHHLITRQQIADKLGISRATVGRILKGV